MEGLDGCHEIPDVATTSTEVAAADDQEINSNIANDEQVLAGLDSNVGQNDEIREDRTAGEIHLTGEMAQNIPENIDADEVPPRSDQEINGNTKTNEQGSAVLDSNVGGNYGQIRENRVGRGMARRFNALRRRAQIQSRRGRQENLIHQMSVVDINDNEMVSRLVAQVDEEIIAHTSDVGRHASNVGGNDEIREEDRNTFDRMCYLRITTIARRRFRQLIQNMEAPLAQPETSPSDRIRIMRQIREFFSLGEIQPFRVLIPNMEVRHQLQVHLSAEKFEEFEKVIYDGKRAEEDKDVCSICLDAREVDQNIVILPCTHKFHYECGKKNFNHYTKCPFCRHDYNE